jgi:hypothetical protein
MHYQLKIQKIRVNHILVSRDFSLNCFVDHNVLCHPWPADSCWWDKFASRCSSTCRRGPLAYIHEHCAQSASMSIGKSNRWLDSLGLRAASQRLEHSYHVSYPTEISNSAVCTHGCRVKLHSEPLMFTSGFFCSSFFPCDNWYLAMGWSPTQKMPRRAT